MVLRARISALKEKVSYRLVLHDENASTANHYELQKSQGGSWVTLDDGMHGIPSTVMILGSGSTNSMNSVTVSGRGVCTTGKLYLQSEYGSMEVVTLDAICYSDME